MSKFRVTFSENTTYTVDVEIDSKDLAEAKKVALQRVRNGDCDEEDSNGIEFEDIKYLGED